MDFDGNVDVSEAELEREMARLTGEIDAEDAGEGMMEGEDDPELMGLMDESFDGEGDEMEMDLELAEKDDKGPTMADTMEHYEGDEGDGDGEEDLLDANVEDGMDKGDEGEEVSESAVPEVAPGEMDDFAEDTNEDEVGEYDEREGGEGKEVEEGEEEEGGGGEREEGVPKAASVMGLVAPTSTTTDNHHPTIDTKVGEGDGDGDGAGEGGGEEVDAEKLRQEMEEARRRATRFMEEGKFEEARVEMEKLSKTQALLERLGVDVSKSAKERAQKQRELESLREELAGTKARATAAMSAGNMEDAMELTTAAERINSRIQELKRELGEEEGGSEVERARSLTVPSSTTSATSTTSSSTFASTPSAATREAQVEAALALKGSEIQQAREVQQRAIESRDLGRIVQARRELNSLMLEHGAIANGRLRPSRAATLTTVRRRADAKVLMEVMRVQREFEEAAVVLAEDYKEAHRAKDDRAVAEIKALIQEAKSTAKEVRRRGTEPFSGAPTVFREIVRIACKGAPLVNRDVKENELVVGVDAVVQVPGKSRSAKVLVGVEVAVNATAVQKLFPAAEGAAAEVILRKSISAPLRRNRTLISALERKTAHIIVKRVISGGWFSKDTEELVGHAEIPLAPLVTTPTIEGTFALLSEAEAAKARRGRRGKAVALEAGPHRPGVRLTIKIRQAANPEQASTIKELEVPRIELYPAPQAPDGFETIVTEILTSGHAPAEVDARETSSHRLSLSGGSGGDGGSRGGVVRAEAAGRAPPSSSKATPARSAPVVAVKPPDKVTLLVSKADIQNPHAANRIFSFDALEAELNRCKALLARDRDSIEKFAMVGAVEARLASLCAERDSGELDLEKYTEGVYKAYQSDLMLAKRLKQLLVKAGADSPTGRQYTVDVKIVVSRLKIMQTELGQLKGMMDDSAYKTITDRVDEGYEKLYQRVAKKWVKDHTPKQAASRPTPSAAGGGSGGRRRTEGSTRPTRSAKHASSSGVKPPKELLLVSKADIQNPHAANRIFSFDALEAELNRCKALLARDRDSIEKFAMVGAVEARLASLCAERDSGELDLEKYTEGVYKAYQSDLMLAKRLKQLLVKAGADSPTGRQYTVDVKIVVSRLKIMQTELGQLKGMMDEDVYSGIEAKVSRELEVVYDRVLRSKVTSRSK